MIRPLFLALALATLGGAATSARAQEAEPTPAAVRYDFWEADLPTGRYVVAFGRLTSVSMHEYVVDGAGRVTEVNIATSGSELARFYYIEPNIPQSPNGIGQSAINTVTDRARDVAKRTGADQILGPVVKNYPTTTHAHTVEYRLSSKELVQKLFESIDTAWRRNRQSVTFKVKD